MVWKTRLILFLSLGIFGLVFHYFKEEKIDSIINRVRIKYNIPGMTIGSFSLSTDNIYVSGERKNDNKAS